MRIDLFLQRISAESHKKNIGQQSYMQFYNRIRQVTCITQLIVPIQWKKKQKQDRTWLRLQWPESQYCLHLLFILCIGYSQFRNPNSQLTRVKSSDHYIFEHICFSCFKCKLYSRLMRSFVIQKGYNILNVAKNKFSMSN